MQTQTQTPTYGQSMTGMVHLIHPTKRAWSGAYIQACGFSKRQQVALFPVTEDEALASKFCKKCAAKA